MPRFESIDTFLLVQPVERSPQPDDSTKASYTYEYGSGNSGAVRAIADTSSTPSAFKATDGLPAVSSTFTSYAVSITAYMATESSLTSKNQEKIEQFAFDGLLELNQEFSGVDVDSELAFCVGARKSVCRLRHGYRHDEIIAGYIE